jgi:hypothetical protein
VDPELHPLQDIDYLLLVRFYLESNLRKEKAVRSARAVKLEFNQKELEGQIPRLVEHYLITINSTWCRLTPEGREIAKEFWGYFQSMYERSSV